MLQHEEEVSMATLRVAPTRHRHTEQFSGILTDLILTQPTPRGREGGMGKPKHKLARNSKQLQQHCEELQASNCVYRSRGAPARGIGPPLLQLGKQLTSIASRLTLPKLHLATLTFFPKKCKTTQHCQSLHLLLFLVPNCSNCMKGKNLFFDKQIINYKYTTCNDLEVAHLHQWFFVYLILDWSNFQIPIIGIWKCCESLWSKSTALSCLALLSLFSCFFFLLLFAVFVCCLLFFAFSPLAGHSPPSFKNIEFFFVLCFSPLSLAFTHLHSRILKLF